MGVSPVQTQTQFVTFGLLVLLMRAALKTLHKFLGLGKGDQGKNTVGNAFHV